MPFTTAENIAEMEKSIEICKLVSENSKDIYYTEYDYFTQTHEFMIKNRKQFSAISTALKGVVWKKEYRERLKWWEICGEYQGSNIRICGCRENPTLCKPIIERQSVTKQVPTEFEDVTTEEDVIVDWDCKEE